jgi:hypothetical protein
MTTFLKMNGNGDYIKIPNTITFSKIVADVKIRRRTDFNRVVWDFRSGIGFSYLQQQTNGTDSTGRGSVKINGVSSSNGTAFIPNDTRCTIEHDLGTTGADDGNIFSNNGVSANTFIDGDIFDIKLYNGTTLVSHYDMTTGTVQDQSGNGKHATLTGGMWVDDGIGGGGTDGSTAFDLKQVIYSDASVASDTKQILYADASIQNDMRNVIYQDGSTPHDLRQSLYEILSTVIDTKQAIYEDSATAFDMLQTYFEDGQIGATHFDMRIQLYADDSALFDSNQSWYEDGLSRFDLAQAIYEASQSHADMKLVIYADGSVGVDLLQRLYVDGSVDYDTLQQLLEEWSEYREVIQIVLNITQSQRMDMTITQQLTTELKL